MAGLCSCSSIHPAPGHLVVAKAECCRSSEEQEVVGGDDNGATSPLRSNSGLVLCPPHLPREYRCNALKIPLPPISHPDIAAKEDPYPALNGREGKWYTPLPPAASASVQVQRISIFSKNSYQYIDILGPGASQRTRGRVEGGRCTCFEGVGNGNVTTRLVCCARQRNEDKVILIQWITG